jgi:hypothetical protein
VVRNQAVFLRYADQYFKGGWYLTITTRRNPLSMYKLLRMVEQICQICHYQREILEKEERSLSGAEAAAEWVAKYARDFPS